MEHILQDISQMQIDSFEHPIFLLFLFVLPLYGIYILYRPKRTFQYLVFPSIGTPPSPSEEMRQHKKYLTLFRTCRSVRFWMSCLFLLLFSCFYFCLTLAMSRPYGATSSGSCRPGIDIYFAIDMSASMKAFDCTLDEIQTRYDRNEFLPNRFEIARATLLDFIDGRAKLCYNSTYAKQRCDRIGITMFAQNAFIAAPLTTHYELLSEQFKKRRINDINAKQSAIGDGLMKSIASLRHSTSESKNIILITDGDRKGGKIGLDMAVQAANLHNIRIFPILIGKSNHAVMMHTDIGGTANFYEAEFPIHFDILESLAKQTNGKAFRASDGQEFKLQLENILDTLEPTLSHDERMKNQTDLSLHFVFLALLFAFAANIVYIAFIRHYP